LTRLSDIRLKLILRNKRSVSPSLLMTSAGHTNNDKVQTGTDRHILYEYAAIDRYTVNKLYEIWHTALKDTGDDKDYRLFL
jgi:hypothetical protein